MRIVPEAIRSGLTATTPIREGSELDSYEASHQAPFHLRRRRAGRAGRCEQRLAIHSYPAEPAVPDPNASFKASRLGDGWRDPSLATARTPCPAPVTRHPRPVDASTPTRRPNSVSYAAFRRAPSGTSPIVTYRHRATSSFLARATAVVLRTRPRADPTRSANQRESTLSGW